MILLLAPACGHDSAPPLPSQRKVIVASVYPVANMVYQFVDPWAQVITLLPEGADMETYELTEEQRTQIATADMVVLAGSGVDDWAVKAQQEVGPPNQRVLVMTRIVVLNAPPGALQHPEAEDDADKIGWPHIWLDPMSQDAFLSTIGKPLEPLFDDARQVSLRGRSSMVRSNGLMIQQRMRSAFDTIRFRNCVADTHAFDPVWSWSKVKPVARLEDMGLSPGQPMDEAALTTLKANVVASSCPAVYVDRPWSDEEVAALREAAGVPVLRLNSYQYDPQHLDYLKLWHANLNTIYMGQRKLVD